MKRKIHKFKINYYKVKREKIRIIYTSKQIKMNKYFCLMYFVKLIFNFNFKIMEMQQKKRDIKMKNLSKDLKIKSAFTNLKKNVTINL